MILKNNAFWNEVSHTWIANLVQDLLRTYSFFLSEWYRALLKSIILLSSKKWWISENHFSNCCLPNLFVRISTFWHEKLKTPKSLPLPTCFIISREPLLKVLYFSLKDHTYKPVLVILTVISLQMQFFVWPAFSQVYLDNNFPV